MTATLARASLRRAVRTLLSAAYCAAADLCSSAATRVGAGLVVAGAVLLAGLLPAAPAAAAVEPTPGARLHGGDISWPNCPEGLGIPSRRTEGKPLPISTASFVIIGLTNGPGFHPNPCLADQLAWARGRGLWTGAYAMTTYPTRAQLATYGRTGPYRAGDRRAALRNTGYQQATFNVASMRATGFEVPFVWVDVEPYPVRPWSRDRLANREVLRGVVRAYEDSGYRVGFYSYDGGWRAVVGGWRKPAYPAWYPVGPERDGWTEASRRCSLPSFSGGPVLLGQWVDGDRDRNVTCARLHGSAAGPHPVSRWRDRRLRVGSSGPAVVALQRALNMTPRYVDGEFGPRTRRVLVAFQRLRGLVPTGYTGAWTWRALGAGTVVTERPSRLPEYFTPY